MNLLKSLFNAGTAVTGVTEAKAQIDSNNPPFILDVRQPEEFHAGHIAGAALIPLTEINRRISELPKDREILCVCRSGSRSGVAAQQLIDAGFKAVNLRGGMIAWQSAGYPVKKGK